MYLNNTNQTPFGIGSITPIEVTKGMAKKIAKIKGKIYEIGHPASDCLIYQGGKRGKVVVKVLTQTSDNTYTTGSAIGKPLTNKGLLKLVLDANNQMNQRFIDQKAFSKCNIQDEFLQDQIIILKRQIKAANK